MAHVAVMTVWVFECPHCGIVSKHWREESAAQSAVFHLFNSHGERNALNRLLERRTWAFRVRRDEMLDEFVPVGTPDPPWR
jgi:hypothetical protein